MKKIRIFLITLILIFNTKLQAYSSDPKMFIDELVNEAILKLSDKNLNNEEKSRIHRKRALENVDIKL